MSQMTTEHMLEVLAERDETGYATLHKYEADAIAARLKALEKMRDAAAAALKSDDGFPRDKIRAAIAILDTVREAK